MMVYRLLEMDLQLQLMGRQFLHSIFTILYRRMIRNEHRNTSSKIGNRQQVWSDENIRTTNRRASARIHSERM